MTKQEVYERLRPYSLEDILPVIVLALQELVNDPHNPATAAAKAREHLATLGV